MYNERQRCVPWYSTKLAKPSIRWFVFPLVLGYFILLIFPAKHFREIPDLNGPFCESHGCTYASFWDSYVFLCSGKHCCVALPRSEFSRSRATGSACDDLSKKTDFFVKLTLRSWPSSYQRTHRRAILFSWWSPPRSCGRVRNTATRLATRWWRFWMPWRRLLRPM